MVVLAPALIQERNFGWCLSVSMVCVGLGSWFSLFAKVGIETLFEMERRG